MSFRSIQPHQSANTNTDIVEYEEPQQQEGIFDGMSWVYIPQAGKKRSRFNNRFDDKRQPVKRDPVQEADWESVQFESRQRLKALLEDIIVVETKQENGEIERREFLQFAVIPLTSYTEWGPRADGQGNAKHGGRQMWAHDDDPKSPKYGQQIQGEEAKIVCSSPDGVAPWPQWVGTTPFRREPNAPFHPRFKRHIEIGKRANGSEIPAKEMCKECPFNDWSDGRPPCGTSWKYIGWAPAQVDINGELFEGGLVVISGPYSVQAAFTGQKAGSKWGHATRNLPRWDDLTKTTGKSKKFVPINDLTEEMLPTVIGLAANENKFRHLKGYDYSEVTPGSITTMGELETHANGVIDSGELETIAFAEIQEVSYAWAPQGLNGEIRPMEMSSVLNNNKGSEQRIPMLTGPKDDNGQYIFPALERREIRDFFGGWAQAMLRRKQWEELTKANIAAIEEKRRQSNVTISGEPEMPQIPAETIQDVDDLDE